MSKKLRVCVVGGGVAGIVSAYLINSRSRAQYDVTLIEAGDRLGGHTNTIPISSGEDAGLRVDTGFIVLNDRTYPTLHKFFAELGVSVRSADMSFSFSCCRSGLEYGSADLGMLFAQRRNALNPSFLRMLWNIRRFWHIAERDLLNDTVGYVTLAEYLERHGLTGRMLQDYIIPISAAMWSASVKNVTDFPALTFLRFFKNHGLLSYTDQPQWQTVIGGSSTYIEAFRNVYTGATVIGDGAVAVERVQDGVIVKRRSGIVEQFDRVIIATHADQALDLLANPTQLERELLGAWSYQNNLCLLHTDPVFMPKHKRAWASWNHRRELNDTDDSPVSVTYHMNKLQGIAAQRQYFVTLNPRVNPAQGSVVKEINYRHPVYSLDALKSQERIESINGADRLWYCGSYHRFGFHEDATAAGVRAAEGVLGQKIEWKGSQLLSEAV